MKYVIRTRISFGRYRNIECALFDNSKIRQYDDRNRSITRDQKDDIVDSVKALLLFNYLYNAKHKHLSDK